MRELFKQVVEQCLAAGLAGTDHAVVDGSHVDADANQAALRDDGRGAAARGRGVTGAVRENLADLETAAPDPVGVTRFPRSRNV
jgi:hypothetical protein